MAGLIGSMEHAHGENMIQWKRDSGMWVVLSWLTDIL